MSWKCPGNIRGFIQLCINGNRYKVWVGSLSPVICQGTVCVGGSFLGYTTFVRLVSRKRLHVHCSYFGRIKLSRVLAGEQETTHYIRGPSPLIALCGHSAKTVSLHSQTSNH